MPKIIWFTGLSGSGKTTIADGLKPHIEPSVILDGDVLRKGLCSDLGFSIEDRQENIRRLAWLCQLFYNQGINVITSFISPMRSSRDFAREIIPAGDFVEVHLSTSLAVCEERDVKGLYARARAGEIPEFTGIDSPYEHPLNPEIVIDTSKVSISTAVGSVIMNIKRQERIKK